MIILTLVSVALYMFSTHQGLVSTETYAQNIEEEVVSASKQMAEFYKLQQEHAVLMCELRTQRKLVLPLRHSQIIAAIGEVFPESVVLNSLKITTADMANRFASSQILDRQRGRKQTDIDLRDVDFLVIEMKGLAAHDQDISVLRTVLADHPLFCDVKAHYSRSTQVNDLLGHAFHLSMAIPLNRDFRPAHPNQLADVEAIQSQSNEESHAIVDQEVADAH